MTTIEPPALAKSTFRQLQCGGKIVALLGHDRGTDFRGHRCNHRCVAGRWQDEMRRTSIGYQAQRLPFPQGGKVGDFNLARSMRLGSRSD